MLSYTMIPDFYHTYSDEHLANIAPTIFEHYPEEATSFFQQHPNAPFHPNFYLDPTHERLQCMHTADAHRTLFFFLSHRLHIDSLVMAFAEQEYHTSGNLAYAILMHYGCYTLEQPYPTTLPSFKDCMAHFNEHSFSLEWRRFFTNNIHFLYNRGFKPLVWRNIVLQHLHDPQDIFDTVFMFSVPTVPMEILQEHMYDTPLESIGVQVAMLIHEGLIPYEHFYAEVKRSYFHTNLEEIPLHV